MRQPKYKVGEIVYKFWNGGISQMRIRNIRYDYNYGELKGIYYDGIGDCNGEVEEEYLFTKKDAFKKLEQDLEEEINRLKRSYKEKIKDIKKFFGYERKFFILEIVKKLTNLKKEIFR